MRRQYLRVRERQHLRVAYEVSEKTTTELDNALEENYMTVHVKTTNGKTISIKCEKNRKQLLLSDEIERRSLIPRGMTYLVHPGQVMNENEKNSMEENNIETETTIEISLRQLGVMERSGLMDTLESEEDREKKKLYEVSEGKLTGPSEDALFLRKEIIDVLKRSQEKNEEKMEQFLQKITDSVGAQLHGMNSTMLKMKEEDDRYKQISERIPNMKKKIFEMDEKYEKRSDEPRGAHVDKNQGKAVITGFHSERSESEVEQLLREAMTEMGMSTENARIECAAKTITHAFIHFKNEEES